MNFICSNIDNKVATPCRFEAICFLMKSKDHKENANNYIIAPQNFFRGRNFGLKLRHAVATSRNDKNGREGKTKTGWILLEKLQISATFAVLQFY